MKSWDFSSEENLAKTTFVFFFPWHLVFYSSLCSYLFFCSIFRLWRNVLCGVSRFSHPLRSSAAAAESNHHSLSFHFETIYSARNWTRSESCRWSFTSRNVWEKKRRPKNQKKNQKERKREICFEKDKNGTLKRWNYDVVLTYVFVWFFFFFLLQWPARFHSRSSLLYHWRFYGTGGESKGR